ncbi:translocation/assembly module TamB domain-containing protein [Psychromonas algicola]|uniref:translocation/assembly module TamB domain-containing protein n=1 Tax=Psychromonas algicola TaxID=2555642 RepID=UPI001068CBD1|nr:translocation/assembly module TamB domain-containing protein [Psychromonas sp. RZ5]TEW52888.1 hypothetical protein E2R67_00340 [Psychromonas sp. RZ5]
MTFNSFASKFIKGLLYTITITASLLFLLLSLVLFTSTGNQDVLSLLSKYEPRLTIDLTEGSLLSSPNIALIKWVDGESSYEFNQVNYEFGLRCLFNTLCIDSLAIKEVKINIQDSEVKETSEIKDPTPFNYNFPLPVYIKDINIQDISVKVAGVEVNADQLLLNADGIDNNLSLSSTINGLTVILADSETIKTEQQVNQKHDLNKDFAAVISEGDLPEVILPFNLNANKLTINGFKLIQNKQEIFVANQADSQFLFQQSNIKIQKLNFDLPEANAQFAGEIDLTANYPMDLTTQIQIKSIDALEPASLLTGQHITLKSQGDLSELHSTFVLSNLINAQGNSSIDLFKPNLPFQFSIESSELTWPLAEKETRFNVRNLHLSSSGDLKEYTLNATSDYDIEGVPEGHFYLTSRGNLHSLSLSELMINTLKGTARLQGKLDWHEQLTWFGDLNIDHINLQELNPTYSSNLSGTIKQSVTLQLSKNNKPDWAFDFPMIDLDGELLQHSLSMKGSLKGDAVNGIDIPQLNIVNAENKITVEGKVADTNDLVLTLTIEDLNKIQPDTYGKLNGTINLTGDIDNIQANTALTASGLKYLTTNARDVEVSGKVSIAALPIADLQVKVKNLIVNKQRMENVSVQITPNSVKQAEIKHDIKLDIDSKIASTELVFLFTQQTDNWLASLNKGMIKSIQGIWTLNQAVDITMVENNLNLSEHCWESSHLQEVKSQICVNRFIAGEQGDIRLKVNDFLLSSLAPLVPETLVLEGGIDSNVNLQWQTNEKPTADLSLIGKFIAFNISGNDDNQDFIRYPVEHLSLHIKTDKEQTTDFALKALSEGLINADFKGKIQQVTQNKPQIAANLDLFVPDFNTFSVLIPQVDQLAGQLQANLLIQGELNKPDLKGQILIADTAIISLQSPVQISDLNANIMVDDSHAKVDGYFFTNSKTTNKKRKSNAFIEGLILLKDTAVSALNIPQRIAEINKVKSTEAASNGRADFTGYLDWENNPKADINFKAEQMHISDYGKTDLYLSPDINVIFDEHLNLQGVIKVDKGEITVKELPEGAITVSKDVVVVDRKVKKTSADLPFSMDLKVNLGEQLHVKALGLDSYIHGDLLVAKTLSKALTVNGELTFSEGTYRAFAQQLVLQNSRVIFQGQPDTPYLSLEAIRDPNNIEDNVTAGVRVTGLPSQLKLTLFSDTGMSQQNVLSYITRGQAIKENSSVTNNQIAAALIGFGTGQTEDLINDIGSTVGINDLALATSGDGDQQSIGVKGTIAPGIELGYGVGVFETFNVFSIRYKLFEKFYIEASTGLSQAVDAYYEWDWD